MLLALDADGLKEVNDRWGHAAGDAYIRHLSSVIVDVVGAAGWVARWGGDEFVVRCSDESSAQALLERIAVALAGSPVLVSSADRVECRVSGGIATSSSTDSPDTLVARADAALYASKRRQTVPGTAPDGAVRQRSRPDRMRLE